MTQQSIHDRIMFRNTGGNAGRMKLKRFRPKAVAISLLTMVLAVAAGLTVTRYDWTEYVLPQPAVAETNEAEQGVASTPFLQHAKQAGLQSCSNVFPALGQLLTNGTTYSVRSIWNNEAADKHVVQALVGMDYATESYSGPAAGLVFAAPTASACEGAMVRVAPFSGKCADIPAMLPNGSKLANNLGPISVYELGAQGGNAMLLPAGNSCVVISVASAAE